MQNNTFKLKKSSASAIRLGNSASHVTDVRILILNEFTAMLRNFRNKPCLIFIFYLCPWGDAYTMTQ